MYISQLYRDYCSVEPVHAHRESHQISMYIGGDPLNIEDFDGNIDVFMGKELERQTLSSCGVVHYVPGCPHVGDEVRVVAKPFIHMMWVIGPHMENYYAAAEQDKVLLSDESKGEVMITPGAATMYRRPKWKTMCGPIPPRPNRATNLADPSEARTLWESMEDPVVRGELFQARLKSLTALFGLACGKKSTGFRTAAARRAEGAEDVESAAGPRKRRRRWGL